MLESFIWYVKAAIYIDALFGGSITKKCQKCQKILGYYLVQTIAFLIKIVYTL